MLSKSSCLSQVSHMSDAFVQLLMNEHGAALEDKGAFQSDMEYMRLNELKYTLKSVRANVAIKLFESFTTPGKVTTAVTGSQSDKEKVEEKRTNFQDMVSRRDHLDSLLNNLDQHIADRLKIKGTESRKAFIPRILQLSDHYKLSPAECSLLHVMVIVQGSTSPYVLNCMVEEDYFKRLQCFQRLSELSEADIDHFCDPERAHLKEGLVTSEEDHGIHYNLRLSRTCVQLLYGRKLHTDELLKVSQTALEVIINVEKQTEEEDIQSRRRSASISHSNSSSSLSATPTGVANGVSKKRKILSSDDEEANATKKAAIDALESTEIDSITSQKLQVMTSDIIGGGELSALTNIENEDDAIDNIVLDDEETIFQPYPADNQLEYLEEGFQVVAVMIRANAARLKDDMKKEGTRMNTWDLGGESKGGRRELQAKFSLLEKRMEKRLAETEKLATEETNCNKTNCQDGTVNVLTNAIESANKGTQSGPKYALPRLEVIAKRLNLDAFEKKLILLLIGKTVSPLVKTLMDTLESGGRFEDMANVGQVLSILCQDFRTQIANRKYFYRSGRLISNGIISMSKGRWHQTAGDLTDQRLMLDRRVLDWAVGLDSEINELVEGSDLYVPKVSLQQVVIPKGHLGPIVKQCRAYDSFCEYRKDRGLERSMCYGNGLVILLCGKSGTGKTMTVNAIAQDLGKKVLLVDFGSLSGRRDGSGELDADLRGLFREAKMSNAVIFFDECETLFRSRDRGGDRLLNALLTEIERHEGIVFLATNRPHELDEAMHRRITSVVQFHSPDFNMRLRIWESLLDVQSDHKNTKMVVNSSGVEVDEINTSAPVPINKLPVSGDVDLSSLAIKYELTGGFIKNALMSALLSALNKFKGNRSIGSAKKGITDVLSCENDSQPIGVDKCALSYADVVLTQNDLEEGCRLQMRASLSVQHQDSKIHPRTGLNKLFLSKELKECTKAILQMENARALVHGAWGGIGGDNISLQKKDKNESISSMLLSGEVDSWSDTRRSTICAFGGPAGSGKRSVMRALAHDLNRTVHMVHASDLVSGIGSGRRGGGEMADTIAAATSLLHDARIGDAVVAIDAFEQLLDQGEDGGRGWKLSMLLSRLLEIFSSFPGLIVLLCHIDNPQNLILHKEFASKIFSFVRFTMPSHDVRSAIWKELTPPNAPLSKCVNYGELGRRFELYPSSIAKAMSRACALAHDRMASAKLISDEKASSKSKSSAVVGLSQKDLLRGGDEEVAKLKGDHMNIMSKMFL